jgi:hypothetical protein
MLIYFFHNYVYNNFKQGNIATALIVKNTGTISGLLLTRRPEPSQLDFLRTGTNGESIGTNEDQK